jgi:dihydrofolate reductase
MRTLIVSEFVSLDGVMEAPGGEPTHPHAGWTMPYGVPEMFAFKFEEVKEAESMLLGRTTYEGFSAAWPERDGEFAEKMNSMPKDVVTSRTGPLGWNATRLDGLDDGVAPAVRRLKDGAGGPILVAGSSTLIRTLLPEGLVDELRLLTFPIAIGGGLRVFPDDRGKITLQLDELVRYDSGVLLQIYRPAAASA